MSNAKTKAQTEIQAGDTAFRAQNHEQALLHYDRALELDDSCREALLKRTTCLNLLSRFEEAVHSADETLRRHPNSAAAWLQKGTTLGALDQLASSLQCFEQALSYEPHNPQALFFKAMAEEGIGLNEEARETYQNFIEVAHPSLEGQLQHARSRLEALSK